MKTLTAKHLKVTMIAAGALFVGLVTVALIAAFGPSTFTKALLTLANAQPAPIKGSIDFTQAPREPSPFGTFPPTEIVDQQQARLQGVKLPSENTEGWTMEIRKTPDGVFVTQLGERKFLTQLPRRAGDPTWRLRVPKGIDGEIHIAAATIESMPALGVARPGEFTRLSWQDVDFQYILVDFSGQWDLDHAINIARSVK